MVMGYNAESATDVHASPAATTAKVFPEASELPSNVELPDPLRMLGGTLITTRTQ